MKNLFDASKDRVGCLFESFKQGIKGVDNIKEMIDTFGNAELYKLIDIKPMVLKLNVDNETPNEPNKYNDYYKAYFQAENRQQFIDKVKKYLNAITDKVNGLIDKENQSLQGHYVIRACQYTDHKEGYVYLTLTILEKEYNKELKRDCDFVMREYRITISFTEFCDKFEF